ncbi:MAG: PhnD/SsuA/transferrin family substrate-binding protein [Bdellovibrionaceae bacterium]|nr:PhnD/SsuA/transferrin family substrate-binding protein [Pseudobdellovibrionaceae bacterium]
MGAVAYAPKVVTIWEGFKDYFYKNGLNFDYILYSNYEAQVEAQFTNSIHIAWNSPLAWVRARRMAKAKGLTLKAIAMRDTDRDLKSVLVINKNSDLAKSGDISKLKGKKIGFGAVDSPQANLIPMAHLQSKGLLKGKDYEPILFDVLGGKHGDHIGGERDAALALIQGKLDASWMIDGNYLAFSKEGTLPSGSTEILDETDFYDHCNFTTSPGAPEDLLEKFIKLLFSMKWEDPLVRPLLELEGLKQWLPGRTELYKLLEEATDQQQFYSPKGELLAKNYRY